MHRLAELYANRSEFGVAYTWYKRAIQAAPKELNYQRDFALAAVRARDFATARDVLRQAVQSDPTAHECAMILARLYALCPDTSIRDGAEALRLAESVCADPERRTPKLLDTLAAAHAELGQREQAMGIYDEALEKARKQDNPNLVDALERHKQQVQEGKTISDLPELSSE
jgi:tetratricopeptide (TPR) repeat protein